MFITFLPDQPMNSELHCNREGQPYILLHGTGEPLSVASFSGLKKSKLWIGILCSKNWSVTNVTAIEKQAIRETVNLLGGSGDVIESDVGTKVAKS